MIKKGAVSLYIVLALLVLLLIGVLIFSQSFKRVEPKEEDYSGYGGSEIESFVNGCLMQASLKGIALLGKQGGVIYQSQGGITADSFKQRESVFYNGSNVWFGVKVGEFQPGDSCNPNHPASVYNPERCPHPYFPFKGKDSPEISFERQFSGGRLSLFNLGPVNSNTLPNLYPMEEPYSSMLPTALYMGNPNIVSVSLRAFIEKELVKCLDFSRFEGMGLVVDKPTSFEVTPILSEEEVYVALKYPIKISRYGKPFMKKESFFVNTKVRYKGVHLLARELLNLEALDFSFDIQSGVSWLPRGLNYSVQVDVDSNKTDILVITDSLSSLPESGGFVPFRFYSAIQNSQPAISYIHWHNLDVVPGLRAGISNCIVRGSKRNNPWEETSARLKAEIGSTIGSEAITCIWDTYRQMLGGYRHIYEPDNDAISWDFKVSHCGWNQPCQFKGVSNIRKWLDGSLKSNLTIRASDGMYEDMLTIPLELHNHPVEDLTVTQIVRLDFFDALGNLHSRAFLYNVSARDEDTYWGSEVDNLTLTVTGCPKITVDPKHRIQDKQVWEVGIELPLLSPPCNAIFTVRDYYGSSASHEEYVG